VIIQNSDLCYQTRYCLAEHYLLRITHVLWDYKDHGPPARQCWSNVSPDAAADSTG
jgi:hypothetical protein